MRRYQTRSPCPLTPDNADSMGKGTRIRPGRSRPVGTGSSARASSSCHRPLRFNQSLRTICGRGYSGWTFCGETSLAQRVNSGDAAGFQSSARAIELAAKRTDVATRISKRFMLCSFEKTNARWNVRPPNGPAERMPPIISLAPEKSSSAASRSCVCQASRGSRSFTRFFRVALRPGY